MLESLYQGNYKDPEFDSPASYYKKALAFLKLDTAFNFRSISMYVKKTWFYKDHIEIKKYHTSRYGVKGEKRDRKCKPTDEAVKKANERNAVAKLRRLLENNFEAGDHHMVLTYKAESRPDPEEAKVILRNFFAKLRRFYKKQGIECKYIITTEWKAKAIHHHVVINDCPGLSKFIASAWIYGGARFTALYADYEYDGLAEYLIKETKETFRDNDSYMRQRYSCSKNLDKPEEVVEIIKADIWKDDPVVPKSLSEKGWYLVKDSIDNGIDIIGYPYQSYILRMLKNVKASHGREYVGARIMNGI